MSNPADIQKARDIAFDPEIRSRNFPDHVLIDLVLKALTAERAPLIKALEEVRSAIIQNATDTLWMHEAASPNCTVVDWIDMALGEEADETE